MNNFEKDPEKNTAVLPQTIIQEDSSSTLDDSDKASSTDFANKKDAEILIKASSPESDPTDKPTINKKCEASLPEAPPADPPKPPPYTAFPLWRKRMILGLVTSAGFLGPLSGSIYLPVLQVIKKEFSISTTVANTTIAVFMIVFAFAPLLWASWADFGGRKFLYIVSLIIYIASCICLAALPAHTAVIFVFRVVQAFGASSVQSLGAGTVADLVEPKNRASAIAVFMLGPQLGPVLGPILGGAIAARDDWRWIFGFLAIIGAVILLMFIFMLPETLRYLVGNGSVYENKLFVHPHLRQKKIVFDDKRFPKPPKPSLIGYLRIMRYIPVTLVSINAGLLFATYYGIAVTYSKYLSSQYHFSTTEVGLGYIVPGVSLASGSLISGRISDKIRKRMIANHPDGKVIPEHRLPIQIFGILVSMAGILCYGWMIDKHVHVVSVMVFSFMSGFGMTWVFVINTTYLTECAPAMPASLVAIASFFRNSGAAISSVIIEPLISRMGVGWCFTGLAFIDFFGLAMVLALVKYGPKWRHDLDQKKLRAKAAAEEKAAAAKSVIQGPAAPMVQEVPEIPQPAPVEVISRSRSRNSLTKTGYLTTQPMPETSTSSPMPKESPVLATQANESLVQDEPLYPKFEQQKQL